MDHFPRLGKNKESLKPITLGSLDHIWPPVPLSFRNGHGLFDEFRSGGFRQKSVTRFCLADLIVFLEGVIFVGKKGGKQNAEAFW